MNLLEHAKNELDVAGLLHSECKEQQVMNKNILELVETFSNQRHSGSTANYVISIVEELLKFKPIRPLTGAEDEWVEVGEGLYQNKRCSSVFKKNDEAYDINGYYIEDQKGVTYTNSEYHMSVTFPYAPKEPERILAHSKSYSEPKLKGNK